MLICTLNNSHFNKYTDFQLLHIAAAYTAVKMPDKKPQQKDDEDWTPCQKSSSKMKNQPPPQSPLENCILHGCKGKVDDIFVAFSSKPDPLSVFKEIQDMKNKLVTKTSDCGGMQDVCESIPDELS